MRDLDRELMALKREEQKLVLEIKAAAKTNNQAAMRVLAKSLVRLRGQMAKLQGSQANLRGVSTNLTTAAASTTVAQSMGTATAAMSKMQQQMNPAKVSGDCLRPAVPPGTAHHTRSVHGAIIALGHVKGAWHPRRSYSLCA